MSSISYRQLARRLQLTQRAHEKAQQSCQAAQQQLSEFMSRSQTAAAQAAALLQTMTTAILAEDQHHVVTLLNHRICELFGLPEEPGYYVGLSSKELLETCPVSFQDAQHFRESREATEQAQQRVSGLLFTLVDGTVIQQDYLPVVQNGHTVLHIWSYEDVTQRQQAQVRLQELSDLAEQSPQPIIRFDASGEARYANPAATTALAALAQPAEAATKQKLYEEINEALTVGKPRTFEMRLDGSYYLWTVAPLGLENGANVYLTDITLRRLAEADLVRSQLFASRINDTVPDIVFLLDMATRSLLYCNRQCEHILGYTESELLAMGPDLTARLFHPDDLQTFGRRQNTLRNLGDGEVLNSEYRLRHRNGEWRWISLKSTSFMRDADGLMAQAVGSAADVSERRNTEEQLRQSRLLMDRITNTTPNLIYIYDLQQQSVVYCNSFVKTMLGYTEAELKAMSSEIFARLAPPPEVERLRHHFEEVAQAADGEVLNLEFFLHHRNGSIRWLRINSTSFDRDSRGRVRQAVGSAEDITRWKIADEQRRSANRRLAEQNRLFRQVIDAAPNLIYLKDRSGNYVLANQATAQLYHMSIETLVQATGEELEKTFPDMVRYRADDERVVSTRQEIAQEETFTDPHGEVHWLNSIKRPFLLADGTVQVLGVDNDITALKNTEHALQKAKEVAEENAQARQNFLTNMSHEIRTPMNGIMGLAELLAKTPLSDQQQHYLHHIRHSAENLLVVINDILDMAQLGAGRIRLETVPFQLDEELKATCQSLLYKATEKGIQLRLQPLPPDVPTRVVGDPYRLRQVLLNLLNNAVKFTERGQVLLTCQRISGPHEPLRLQFSVLDTGIGIPAGQLEQMFEPFAQASASTAREYGGSGLGLSISRGLIELLGGELTAESKLHQGSTFRFTLPFEVAYDVPTPAEEPAPNYQALGHRRILLAEDNAVNQLLVQAMLEGWGLHVDVASSGQEALAMFRQQVYDVVLMDIQMPGMDGVAATRLLRQHPDPERAATPVVALTAHAMQGEAERYLSAGLNAYLSKPFREQDLFRTITGLLNDAPLPVPLPSPAVPSLPPDNPAAPLYDLSELRRHTNADEVFIRRLADLFINTTPPVVAELEAALANQDREKIADAAHHLKSSVGGLQVHSLYTVLRALEAACTETEAPDIDTLTGYVQQVRQTLDEVISQLRQEFPV